MFMSLMYSYSFLYTLHVYVSNTDYYVAEKTHNI